MNTVAETERKQIVGEELFKDFKNKVIEILDSCEGNFTDVIEQLEKQIIEDKQDLIDSELTDNESSRLLAVDSAIDRRMGK
jgi:hypothetical protein